MLIHLGEHIFFQNTKKSNLVFSFNQNLMTPNVIIVVYISKISVIKNSAVDIP